MEISYWNDQPISTIKEDHFDFEDYADALCNVVLQSKTPLTIGIFGPWGAGKTSLMQLTAKQLQDRRTTEHRRAHVVWFNAWRYDRDRSAIWRTLLLQVLEMLKQLELREADLQRIQDWESQLYADVDRTERGSLEIDWPQLSKGALKIGLSLMPSPTNVLELLKVLNGETSSLENVVQAFKREEIRIHRGRLHLLEEFRSGFARLVDAYIWRRNGLLVLCIDDLDRCLPEHALEVIETIKLFLDVPGCAFLLAADHRRIEQVVRQRFETEDDEVGQGYLEKLVQLPFYLPPIDDEQVADFLDRTAPELPEEVRRIFAAGLVSNPRMVKRTLNIFRLLEMLAARRVDRGALSAFDPTLLAKLVVIQTRFRDLYHDLREYPNLLQELELRATGRDDLLPFTGVVEEEVKPLVERYTGLRSLMRMLSLGASFVDLAPSQISAYIYLAMSTGQEPDVEVPIRQRLWDDLLSNDLTRLRAAVGQLRQLGQADIYVEALSALLQRKKSTTWESRLSAATALGYLGDPRDFDAVIEIPGGEFICGETNEICYLGSYRISKYPVTNAQYARFLAAHPERPVPYVEADWASPYNWDPKRRTYPEGKANMPVLLITWEDAHAYCAWVGGRLPTELEWERAARGDDGRLYPWGDIPDVGRANVRESGLGSPTPVGVYLEGASPYGLLDAAGNVWEWTADNFNGVTKTIRGGAWNFSLDSARTFVRECSRPDNRSHSIGFRVAFDV
ncbi:MAG: SUMF1/EgtB/PvdO family nonheme iron enzyme [Anaerolineae bacterium]